MVERRGGRAYSLSATNKDDRYIRVLAGGGRRRMVKASRKKVEKKRDYNHYTKNK